MKYAVIALDLDGTLTNNAKEVTPRTREALRRAMEGGAVVVLASGRPTYGVAPVAETLGLEHYESYLLPFNGGKIVHWPTKREIYGRHLPDEVIPLLVHYAEVHGHALVGYRERQILTQHPDDPYVAEEARINKMEICGVDNLLHALEPHPVKLLLTGHPDDMVRAERELSELLADRMEVFRSAPFFVELMPKGIDKAQSLARLLDHLHLSPADLVAFGDGYNDLSMIRFAGMGVAMDNAAPELRAVADYITLSNEQDGVAAALEHFEAAD